MNERPSRSVERRLDWLADFVCRRRRLIFAFHAVLCVVSVLFTIRYLEFSSERNDLVGSERRYHKNFLRFKEDFHVRDDIVVVIESADAERNREFVERLARRLLAEPRLFSQVFYKGDLQALGSKALLFIPPPQLAEFEKTLHEVRPFLTQFTRATNLASLFVLINAEFRKGARESPEEASRLVEALPALRRILERASESLTLEGTPVSPGVEALFGAGEQAERERYVTFGGGRFYLVSAQSRTDELEAEAIARIRELVDVVQREVPGVNAGVTGESVLEIDEMKQSQKDTLRASAIALALVLALFVYGYHETGRPIKATISLVAGLAYTMAYTTWTVGHLNILTITFAPILIGLAIDFGVHFISRFEEELHRGSGAEKAVHAAMTQTGKGIFTGCLTTAGAFFAMALTDFKGIQEMGIITGGGMVICLVPMMTLLPAMLMQGKGQGKGERRDRPESKGSRRRSRLERLWMSRPGLALGGALVVTALLAIPIRSVHFDYNLLNMQSAGLPAVVFTKKLIQSEKSVLFGAVIAENAEEAMRLRERLIALPSVAEIDTLAPYLTGDSRASLEIAERIREAVSDLRFEPIDPDPVRMEELEETLWRLNGYLQLALTQVPEEKTAIRSSLESLAQACNRFRKQLRTLPEAAVRSKLTSYQQGLLRDVHQTIGTLQSQRTGDLLSVEDLPEELRSRFVGKSGKHLLQVYPRNNVWERRHQERFVEELRTVDPDVTGTPVQLLEYTSLLKESYVDAAYYAFAAIGVLVALHFRGVVASLLSLLPVIIGGVWMAGLMGWLGIPFNPANIMTLPLIIGIGVTNGIHILNRYREERDPSLFSRSTGKAVVMSAMTTVSGFGSLIFADHQGIASLGAIMSIGALACMIASVAVLPALLELAERRQWRLF